MLIDKNKMNQISNLRFLKISEACPKLAYAYICSGQHHIILCKHIGKTLINESGEVCIYIT